MKRIPIAMLVVLIILLSARDGIAQLRVLTLDSTYHAAREAFAGNEQLISLSESHRLALESIKATLLPKSQLVASATYQSDVTSLNINIPMFSIPKMSNDSYKAYLDVNQLIYDGGGSKARRATQMVQHELDNLQVESDFYHIKELATDLFFAVIMGRKTKELLVTGLDQLSARRSSAASAVANGVMLASQLEFIDVELAVQNQRIIEVDYVVNSAIQMLSVWTNLRLDTSVSFVIAPMDVAIGNEMNVRPEEAIFGLQQKKLDQIGRQVAARTMPMLSGFGQVGYGRPGLNMLNNEFDSWYLVGVRFQWNFWDWKQTSHERAQHRLQQEIIGYQKTNYDRRIQAQLASVRSDMEKMQGVLLLDGQIIESRKKISRAAASQFDNGVLDAADLVARNNETTQAQINYEIHKLQLIQYQVKYLTTLGQL